MDRLRHFVDSGILERYVLGELNENEKQEFEDILSIYPELREQLLATEMFLPPGSTDNEVPPPINTTHVWDSIQAGKLIRYEDAKPRRERRRNWFIQIKETLPGYIKEDKGIVAYVIIIVFFLAASIGAIIWIKKHMH